MRSKISKFMVLFLTVGSGSASAQDPIWTEGGTSGISPSDPLRFDTIRQLAESLGPAVVNISVALSPYDPFSGGYAEGEGSGFIIDADGYVLTNFHVVENASAILVRLIDDREFRATVVGSDPRTDIALLKIEADDSLPILPLGASEDLHVGDWVVAIGSPLGLDFTVTAGIVSALGRRDVHPDGRELYENFIQTDASINPGNSGGPLINLAGEVVGINSAVNTLGQGIGFAIPIDMVKAIIPQLLETGTVTRSCIGIQIQPLTRELAMSYGLDTPHGALVVAVNPGGPADEGGIQPGDVVLRFNDELIEESSELPWLASIAGVGTEVDLEVLRGDSQSEISVTLGELPCSGDVAVARSPGGDGASPLGISVQELDDGTRAALGIPEDTGVIIADIAAASPARGSGLRTGDIILEVGSSPVTDPEQFASLLESFPSGAILRLSIRRGTAWVFIAFTVP